MLRKKEKYIAKVISALLVFCMVFSNGALITLADKPEQNQVEEVQKTNFIRSESNTRNVINFNDDWKFKWAGAANNPQPPVGEPNKKDYDDSDWRKISLPHDFSIELDFNLDNSLVGSEAGWLDGGTGWYRKNFTLPESMKDKKVAIYFGGVYKDSTVWVNGKNIGTYPNGYTPFTYDLTDHLITDGVTENVITVRAINNQPSSRWYSGSGIYRNVDLIVTEPIHVENYGTYVTTPDIENENENGGNVTVNIKTDVVNKSNEAATVTVRNSILNYKDDSVFTKPETTPATTIQAGETKEIEGILKADNPKLWHTNEGNLYKIKTEILNNDVVVDTYYTDFGFRWFEFDNNEGFSLNGEYMKLNGVCMHHDQGALGSVANYRAIERQMDIMQEMGVNAIRVTHNPAADELIEICEKKGLLVIDEAFDTWYHGKKDYDMGKFFEQEAFFAGQDMGMTWGEYDIKQMVERGKNSPAIIMWSLGNEIGEADGYAKSVETVKNLSKWVKEVDKTRPVTMGEDKFRMYPDPNALFTQVQNELDVVGMNYAEDKYDTFREGHKDWVIYGSETSSATKSRGIYQHPDTDGVGDAAAHPDYQQSSYDNDHVGWGKTASNSWIPDRDRKYIAGQFIWTGFDYIGEPTPWNNNKDVLGHDKSPKSSFFGIVDTAGIPKDDYYLYQSQWLDVEKNPMVHILPHWNWEDKDLLDKVIDKDGKIPVRVYSNAKTIDLYQTIGNGSEVLLETKSFATKTTDYGVTYQQAGEGDTSADKKLYLEWRIPYKAGKLRAVAKNEKGDIIAETAITSAAQPAKIGLTPDRQIIKADGYDLSYITVDINDSKGNVVPTGDNLVKFTIEGDGEIVGVDNGDATSHERYKAQKDGSWQRKAFSGKAIVIVKSTKKAGSFTLTASSRGLASNKIKGYTVESTDSDIKTLLGYNVQSSVITKVNQQPELPKKVVALFSDSSTQEKDVSWNAIKEEQLAASNSFELQGTVDGTNDTVQIMIQVKDISTVKEIRAITGLNTLPNLPDVVEVLYDDASKEEKGVTWDTITPDQVATVGTFTISGTILGIEELKAKATIRVVAEKKSKNIAASAFGTKASASYVENNGAHPANELNDGILSSGNGWGNWGKDNEGKHRENDDVTFEFQDSYEVKALRAYFSDQATMTKPDSMIINYWDEEAQDFVPVNNQSQSEGFTTVSEEDDEGNLVTFDPVTTNKIKCEFTVAYPNTKDMLKVIEIEILSDFYDLSMKKSAVLSDILLDGQPLEEFDGSNYYYEKEISYPYKIPVVTAMADDNAGVTVVQAIKVDGRVVIDVTSEDGSNSNTYEIQFSKRPLQLTSLDIVLEKTTMVEDESVGFDVQGILEDGSAADPELLNLTYDTTSNDGGKIVIEGKDIQAYNKGNVQLVVTAEYAGGKMVIDPIDFIIYENIEEKNVVSYEKLTVVTNKGEAPVLPDKIQVYMDKGFPKEMEVKWNTVDSQLYNEFGKFSVKGEIIGEIMQPIITVSVEGVLEVQKFSGVTPVNFPPVLPKKAPVYMSDGTVVYKDITWDLEDVDLSKEGIVKVFGSLENDDLKVTRSTENQVEMNLRITSDVSTGGNVARQWTGADIPMALASYTNDGKSSLDRVEALNDNNTNDNNKWSNWISGGYQEDESVWVGILFGNSGELTQRSIDNMKAWIFTDEGCLLPSKVMIQYYTGEVPTLPNTDKRGHMGESPNDPLSKDENWADVKGLKYDSLVEKGWSDFTFEPVRTYALRLKMNPQAGKSIGLREIQIFDKVAQVNQDFAVDSITVNGNPLADFNMNKEEYSVVLDNSDIPEVSVSATNNAAVTVVQAISPEGKARINITSEDGKLVKDYTINFTSPSAPKNIISIEDSQILSVSTGAAFDTISPPEQVKVTLDNGDKKDIDVTWDPTNYNENNVGVYMLKGEFELPEGVINKSDINPFLAVRVGSDEDVSLKPNFIRFTVKKDKLIQNEVVFPMIYATKGAQYFIYESLDSKESIISGKMETTSNSALSIPEQKADGVSKDYQVEISGTDLILKHATNVEAKEYYISAMDSGKLESPRTKITVLEADIINYNVNLNQSQGGLITSDAEDGLIMEGLNLTLTFTPTPGYELVEAIVNNKVVALDKNNQFVVENVQENITAAARFRQTGSSSSADNATSDINKVDEVTVKAMSDAVSQAKKGDTATLVIKEGQSRIPDSILKLAKDKGVNLTFVQGDIVCTISAKDIKELPEGISYDVGLKLITDTDISALTKDETAVMFQLNGSGKYPFTMKLELNAGTKLKGKMMFVNRYNPETKRLEYVSVDDVNTKGIVIGTVNESGKYVLSNVCGFVEKPIAKITGKTNNSTGKSGKVTLKADLGSKDVTVKQLSWKASNTKYASVDKNGVVTAKKAGKGKTISVTAAALDGSKAKKTFKVYLGTPVAKITVAKSNPKTVLVGKKTKIKYSIPTKTATNKNVVFSSNNKYVKIDKNGNIVASKGAKGKVVTITIKAKDGQGAKSQFKIKIK